MPTEASSEDVQGWVAWGSEIGRGWAETIGNIAKDEPATTTTTNTYVTSPRANGGSGSPGFMADMGPTGKTVMGAGAGFGAAYLADKNPLIGAGVGALLGWAWSGGLDRFKNDRA